MTEHEPMSRRAALAAVLSAGAVAGVGCSKSRDASSDESSDVSSDESSTTTTSNATTDDGYEPTVDGEWATASAAEAGFSAAGLAELLQLVGNSNSQSFLLLWNGRVVAEQYWRGADATSVKDVASVQKVMVSTLMGLARDQSLLGFDDPISEYLGDGWSLARDADERLITVSQLLTMTSGLNPRNLRRAAPPGTVWDYNTDAYQKLRRVLEVVAGTDINTLSNEWLFDVVGFDAESPWRQRPGEPDATGDRQWGVVVGARDLVRFGLFAMRHGRWGGDQVAAAGWFEEAWSPIALKRDYGYLWWLLGRGPLSDRGAPIDLVAGLGAGDQKLYVLPSSALVIVRQGEAAKEVTEAGSDFDALLLAALAAARV